MKENEENPNHIELLRQALLFYANKENYESNQPVGNELGSMIELDNGSQARFALANLDKLREFDNKMEADYMKNVNEAIQTRASRSCTLVLGNQNLS